jgi:hypothetical protein
MTPREGRGVCHHVPNAQRQQPNGTPGKKPPALPGELLLRRLNLTRLTLFSLSPCERMAQRVYTKICRFGASA